jgi:hypothetical protein
VRICEDDEVLKREEKKIVGEGLRQWKKFYSLSITFNPYNLKTS